MGLNVGTRIEIIGQGKVEKDSSSGFPIFTAIPDENWKFKCFKYGEFTSYENPLNTSNYIIELETIFYVTIEDYLRGLVGFDVAESALNSIRVYRQTEKYADVLELSIKEKELLYADLLMWAATNPTSYTGSKDSDGGWTHTEAGKTISVTDKKRFENTANAIYKKYQDRKYRSGIKLVNLW